VTGIATHTKAAGAVEERLERAELDETALGGTTPLPEFLAQAGGLEPAQRMLLVDQALVLIEDLYVHLPLKRAMHAIDPVQRLKLLRRRLDRMSERRFHDELIRIFTGLRDLHTNYILPEPYQSKTAFLPFLIEEFFEQGERRYLVSKTFAGFEHPTFKPGVVLTYWNGMPIDRAVELNADRQAGSNDDARHARGLEAMTIRPMSMSAPPDEEWVVVGYTDGQQDQALLIDWHVFQPDPAPHGADPNSPDHPAARSLGIDAKTEAVRRAKKALFAPQAMARERRRAAAEDLTTSSTMPDVFSFRSVKTKPGTFGYIRIWTFNVDDAGAFLKEFLRIAALLPQKGLILDVRGNGGGLISAGERLLQVLTPRAIEPERLDFVNTPLTLRLVQETDFLEPWRESIAQAVELGTTYSLGFPIDPVEEVNDLGQQYRGPVVLITDALIYSTTDIFTAGFQDHAIGPILGTSGNTGAGGANVWTHDLLRQLMTGPDSPFAALPAGASFRVAIRRTTRVGEHAGVPVEDVGVVPDEVHQMTRADVLTDNRDLLERAGAILSRLPAYELDVKTRGRADHVEVKAKTKHLSRLDVFVDARPLETLDVRDGETSFDVPGAKSGKRVLELRGFDGETLAACTRKAV
jgi:C-terminal processing protease CtpA/Prc